MLLQFTTESQKPSIQNNISDKNEQISNAFTNVTLKKMTINFYLLVEVVVSTDTTVDDNPFF